MSSSRCATCGLVNFATSEACRRCGGALVPEPALTEAPSLPELGGRSLGRWLLWMCGATVTILMTAYLSLLVTSEGLTGDEHALVMDAVAVLEQAGFPKESRGLRHLASYRSTDNWWNRYVGHPTAYAATNFPFGVVTLYPAFFKAPIDDTERAVILLHEAHHLFGAGEEEALRHVWTEKDRLGWTAAAYGHTRVWKNTREWTGGAVPGLFACGFDGRSDCLH